MHTFSSIDAGPSKREPPEQIHVTVRLITERRPAKFLRAMMFNRRWIATIKSDLVSVASFGDW